MVFAADKISKIREFSLGRPPRPPSQRRMTHYRRCVEMLEPRSGDSPLVLQLRSEFDQLSASPALRPAFA
jgi:hypothetical protein